MTGKSDTMKNSNALIIQSRFWDITALNDFQLSGTGSMRVAWGPRAPLPAALCRSYQRTPWGHNVLWHPPLPSYNTDCPSNTHN